MRWDFQGSDALTEQMAIRGHLVQQLISRMLRRYGISYAQLELRPDFTQGRFFGISAQAAQALVAALSEELPRALGLSYSAPWAASPSSPL